jgi:sulfur carrier protein ThiS
MEITFSGRDHNCRIEVGPNSTLRQALVLAKILPSTVIVSYEEKILPHSTVLNSDVHLIVTTVSSGG